MFGERYFATRQRLTEVIAGVRELGIECEADVADLEDDGEFLGELRKPFNFVVCGEVNAGKSTLLNGLFGESFCEVDELPTTKQFKKHVHEEDAENLSAEGVTLCGARLDFLKEFHVLDSPGSNVLTAEQGATFEQALLTADILLFTFPTSNPWAASTWQIVAKLPEEQLRNAAFVLQHADLKSGDDVKLLMGHMQKLAEQKTGFVPEIYAVSATMACDAKSTEPMVNHLWKKSGFPPLETFISRRVTGSGERWRLLRDLRDLAENALVRIEAQIEGRRATLDYDERFLQELENEVEARREGQANFFSSRLSGLGEIFHEQGLEAAKTLRTQLSWTQSLLSLFRQELIPTTIERNLTEAVKVAVQEQAKADGEELVENCRLHWETVEPRIEENLAVTAPSFQRDAEALSGTSERFVERLGQSAKQGVANLKIRGTLELQLEGRRAILRRHIGGALMALTLTGLAGGLGWHPLPWLGLLLAIYFIVVAVVYAEKTRKSLHQDFLDRVDDLQQPFSESLTDDYQYGVREFYVEYGQLFEIVRRRIVDQRALLKPRLKRWNDLFLETKAIEQGI